MPIPPSDEMLVKEEIRSAILEKALIEMATEIAKRDPKYFGIVVERVVHVLKTHPVKRFVPPQSAAANAVDVERLQQEGFRIAVETVHAALYRVLKRFGPRKKI